MKNAYKNSELNVEIFGKNRLEKLSDYFASTRHFFSERYLPKKFSMLDIGGSSGNFIEALNSEGFSVKGAVIDPDPLSIQEGREKRKGVDFFEDYFPSRKYQMNDDGYDVVSMQALFPQIPTWKETVIEMVRIAKKFVNISLTFQLEDSAVIDKDRSYFYYLDTGERVHQVIHNIYEFTNFLSIHELRVKKINFYGYHTMSPGDNFRSVPNDKQIKGNLLLELFEAGEQYPDRMGGAVI